MNRDARVDDLVTALRNVADIDDAELLERFDAAVKRRFDEKEFAQIFGRFHTLYHAWMDGP